MDGGRRAAGATRSRPRAEHFLLACALSAIAATGSLARADGFEAIAVQGPGALARLRLALGADGWAGVLAVNRVDAAHAARLDSLVLPPEGRSLLELSPFPASLAAAEPEATLLLVSARAQAFAAYDSGRLVRWGPISSGGPAAQTAPGSYRANWKARRHVSTFDSTWVMPWCVNLDNTDGTALHAYALPGRPASHCCIRLLEPDARWVYDWIEIEATPVLVLDAYDFDAPPPWRRLVADPRACDVPEALIESAVGWAHRSRLSGERAERAP